MDHDALNKILMPNAIKSMHQVMVFALRLHCCRSLFFSLSFLSFPFLSHLGSCKWHHCNIVVEWADETFWTSFFSVLVVCLGWHLLWTVHVSLQQVISSPKVIICTKLLLWCHCTWKTAASEPHQHQRIIDSISKQCHFLTDFGQWSYLSRKIAHSWNSGACTAVIWLLWLRGPIKSGTLKIFLSHNYILAEWIVCCMDS